MRAFGFLLALAAAAPISAISLEPRANKCPAIWTSVAATLKKDFAGCGQSAHGAIRAVFHDCINNGCDGSLILANEYTRKENAGLSFIAQKLIAWKAQFGVGAADLIQFAGAMAISQCPLGPRVEAWVGRRDSAVAAPPNSIPGSRDSVQKILAAFAAKGFSAQDVVALLGTHSVAVQQFDDPSQAGKSLDSTPSKMDIRFYSETKFGTAPYSLQSDRLMSNASETRNPWAIFSKSTGLWSQAFIPAWNRFALIGNDRNSLADCSALIPQSSVRRDRIEANERFVDTLRKRFIG